MVPDTTMQRILQALPEIHEEYESVIIYDEQGIRENARRIIDAFGNIGVPYHPLYAIKANSNPFILKMLKECGFGVDASQPTELGLARRVGFSPNSIMFSSNNTTRKKFERALADGGSILNIDDFSFIDHVPDPFPKTVSFRVNPGKKVQFQDGNIFPGDPSGTKFGVPIEQLAQAFKKARERGAEEFLLHTMIISNEPNCTLFPQVFQLLLETADELWEKHGIRIDGINTGGGFGIPYEPGQDWFSYDAVAGGAKQHFDAFRNKHGYVPRLYNEPGRCVTGPYGVLASTVENRMEKYKRFIGLDADCVASIMRPAMYHAAGGGYHHISIVNGDTWDLRGSADEPTETVSVVGSICEDIDRFAWDRKLPVSKIGDIALVHDVGAHAAAMATPYNNTLRPGEVLLHPDGAFTEIVRPETEEDLFRRYSWPS